MWIPRCPGGALVVLAPDVDCPALVQPIIRPPHPLYVEAGLLPPPLPGLRVVRRLHRGLLHVHPPVLRLLPGREGLAAVTRSVSQLQLVLQTIHRFYNRFHKHGEGPY